MNLIITQMKEQIKRATLKNIINQIKSNLIYGNKHSSGKYPDVKNLGLSFEQKYALIYNFHYDLNYFSMQQPWKEDTKEKRNVTLETASELNYIIMSC